ncbi:MFS transporter [soil metagenome]
MEKAKDPYSALRNKEFRFFVWGKLVLTIALQMQAVIASWLIYNQTKDPLSLGLIGLVEAVPALSLALPGGHLADRFNRRHILLISTSVMLLASVLLSIYAYSFLHYGTWPAFVVIFLIGLARGFYNPAQSSFWAQILKREHYVNGSVWNSSMWQLGAVTGPALGGLCYAWIGPADSSIIVCGLMLVTLFYYYRISNKPIPVFDQNESIGLSLKAGLNYFFKQPLLISAISLDLFAVLFGGAVALLPAFADQILHTGPEGLGFLRSAPAIGSVMMAITMAFYPPRKNAGYKMLGCVAGFGCCMIGFALSKNYALSFLMLMMSGMFDNVSVVIRSTILQIYTPDEMRGRIAAVNSIFVGSSNELGAFESGVTAKIFGLVNSVLFGGCMTLIVTAVTYKLAPALKKLKL